MYAVNTKKTQTELEDQATYDYWNNEEEEKQKEWDIRDGNFSKLETYIADSGLRADLISVLERSGLRDRKGIYGAELGAGVCWTASTIFEYLDIAQMHYLEFSYHRIAKIAPLILEHYSIPEDRVRLELGSFYETGYDDESMDFVLLSQALHHAAEVERLMREVHRILKEDGVALIIGEDKVPSWNVCKRLLAIGRDALLKGKNAESVQLYKQNGCLKLDKELGDRCYSRFRYRRLFKKCGFDSIIVDGTNVDNCSFVCRKVKRA